MGRETVINLSCYQETGFLPERVLLGIAILPLIMYYYIMKTAVQSNSSFIQQIFNLMWYELIEVKLGLKIAEGDISNKRISSVVFSQ